MKDGSRQASPIDQPYTQCDVAYLGNENIGEHSLKIGLAQCQYTTEKNSYDGHPAKNGGYGDQFHGEIRLKHRKDNPYHHVCPYFGRQGSNQGAYR